MLNSSMIAAMSSNDCWSLSLWCVNADNRARCDNARCAPTRLTSTASDRELLNMKDVVELPTSEITARDRKALALLHSAGKRIRTAHSNNLRIPAHGFMNRKVSLLKQREKSQPISRVLSWTVIHLGAASPRRSSNLPESSVGHGHGRSRCFPIWSCSKWGLPCHRCCHQRGALLPTPFQPYRHYVLRRYIFCGTFRRLAPPRRYLALCPMEPGLSSTTQCRRDCLADSARTVP